MGYRAYPDYKKSGVEWLPAIPKHWEIRRLKFMATIQNGRDYKDVENDDGVPVIGSGGQFTWASEFLYDGESVLFGRKGTIDKPLHINCKFWTVDTMFYSIIQPDVFGRYLYYFSTIFQYEKLATQTALPSVTQHDLGNYLLCYPCVNEQRAIANFLDHKTAQIDRLIEKKQELIEKLQEQRATVFTQAVTKGLNSHVTLMDSGLEWLGEIPAHWKVAPLRRFIARMEQGWSPSCEDRPAAADEWAVLKSGCVNGGIFREDEHKTMPQELDPPLSLEVRPRDVLMCRASGSRHLIGSVAQVKECREKLIFSDKTYRITVDHNSLIPEFFTMAMSSKYMREQIELSISGAEGLANNIPQSLVKSYIFAVPTLEEQNRIVERLAAFSESAKEREQAINEAITRLQEYRTALVTAAVTGQIDVRDWQAPEPTKEPADKEVA